MKHKQKTWIRYQCCSAKISLLEARKLARLGFITPFKESKSRKEYVFSEKFLAQLRLLKNVSFPLSEAINSL